MITLPGSEYFTLRTIGNGIYAAIARDGSPAYSNAGFVDTGDHVLIFDTFNTFRAALDLRHQIEIVARKPPDYVFISHSHSDHWMGNQAFADQATILASRYTTNAMAEWSVYYKALKRNPQKAITRIQETEMRLANAQDSRLQAHLSWSLMIERHEYRNLAATELHLPNQSFDSKLEIYGIDAFVKIMTLGAGHTVSDTIMVLPEDRTAFIGDLGFFQTHPYLVGSNPEKWVAILDELAASKLEKFVPGHGPVGSRADLRALKSYILTLQGMVAAVANCGGSEDDAANQPIPDYAANWAGFGRYEQSMRYLYQWQTKKDMDARPHADFSRSLLQEVEAAGYTFDGVEFSSPTLNPNYEPPDEK